MVDPKKLITGFLLLSVLVSSFIFIFSNFGSEKPEVSDLQVSSGSQKTESKNTDPFFENLPLDEFGISVSLPEPVGEVLGSELPPIEDPSNLTDNLAQKLVAEMATLDPNENITIEMGADKISRKIEFFSGEIARNNLDQDLISFQKNIDQISNNFRLNKNASTDDILNYNDAVNSILEENFSRFSSLSLEGEDINGPVVASFELAVDIAIEKIGKMEVPEAMVNFHKGLLKLLAYQKNIFGMAADQEDPLRLALVLQYKEQDYNAAIEDLRSEYEKLNKNSQVLGGEKKGVLESFSLLFSIKKAHASGWPVIDIAKIAQDAWHWLKQTLTQVVKKKLIDQMVKQTIRWVQGGGKPKFIKDFKGFVVGEADKAVGGEIYKHFPQLCSPIAPYVRSAFSSAGTSRKTTDSKEYTRCTLGDIVNNIKDFYDNFSVGGWGNYLESIKPQNNTFGSIMILSDIALKTRAEEEDSARTSAQAAGGLLATRKCMVVKNHTINQALSMGVLSEDEISEPPLPADAFLALQRWGETPVNANGAEIKANEVSTGTFYGCRQEDWQITTPGTLVGDIVAKSAGSHLDFILSAEQISALVAAVVDSLTSKIITAGAEGLTNNTVAKKSPKESLEALKKSCENFSSSTPEYQDCLDNVAEIAKVYESVRIPTSTLVQTATAYMGIFGQVIVYNNQFLALVPIFNETATFALSPSNCPGFLNAHPEYYDLMAETNSSIPEAIKSSAEASSSTKWLIDYIDRVSAATTPDEVDTLTEELENKFEAKMISFMLQEAKERYNLLLERHKNTIKYLNDAGCALPP